MHSKLNKERPNILFITTDMQKLDTLGCYGDRVIKTPNMDRLAREGVRFTNAFVNNPVCMPSRASLITGKVPSAHGVRWNSGGLRKEEITLTKRLQESGYETAAVGKMHWGDAACDFGLDYWNWTDHGQSTSPGVENYSQTLKDAGLDQVPDVMSLPGYRDNYGAVASPLPEDYHLDGFIANAAVEFLEKRDESKPFFCWCSFFGPHLPIDPSPPWDKMYDPNDIPMPVWDDNEFADKPPEQRAFQQNENRGNGFGDYRKITHDPDKLKRFIAHYWGKISMIDSFIGKIVRTLEEKGLKDDTVIIFTSDHGDFVGNHRLLFKSAFLYDDLLRVPLIVSWPGAIEPRTSDCFAEEIDITATIAELTGVGVRQGMQGRSLVSWLEGKTPLWRDHVYAEAVDQRMIRTTEWKLVHYGGKPYGELYNMKEDPHELHNLYHRPDLQPVREELLKRLLDRQIELEAALHPPVDYLELDDPGSPGSRERRVRLPYI